MFAKPDLPVAPVTPERIDAVRALRVAPEQQPFVGDTGFNLDDALRDENSEAMAILVGATPVGFYRLDFRPTIVARRSIGETSVGLRAFFLDVDWQGRGLGTRAVQACCEDVHARHPDRRLLALNVRSEEHTSELQSLMRNSDTVFCLKKKKRRVRKVTKE